MSQESLSYFKMFLFNTFIYMPRVCVCVRARAHAHACGRPQDRLLLITQMLLTAGNHILLIKFQTESLKAKKKGKNLKKRVFKVSRFSLSPVTFSHQHPIYIYYKIKSIINILLHNRDDWTGFSSDFVHPENTLRHFLNLDKHRIFPMITESCKSVYKCE